MEIKLVKWHKVKSHRALILWKFWTLRLSTLDEHQKLLIKLAYTKMPYGKYEGKYLIDLPEYYLVWLQNNRLPKGQLGEQLKLVYELRLNGLEDLIRNIKKQYPKPI